MPVMMRGPIGLLGSGEPCLRSLGHLNTYSIVVVHIKHKPYLVANVDCSRVSYCLGKSCTGELHQSNSRCFDQLEPPLEGNNYHGVRTPQTKTAEL